MNAATTDFERQLREALDKATANAPEANKDLVRLALRRPMPYPR